MCKKSKTKHFSYIMELNDYRTGKRKYLKVGYTNNLNRRMEELENKYDCVVNLLKFYWFNKKEPALMLEDVMRMHFKEIKGSHYIMQDRFQRTTPTEKDYVYIEQEAKHLAERYDN